MANPVAKAFESGFLSQALSDQIAQCDGYELSPLFLSLFRTRQPVLEAGCGSGRWCAWLISQGIRSDGVDWSQELCDRAAREIPGARFHACDMSALPVPDRSYGGIVALGAVEHTAAGPVPALAEFRRLLAPGGVAVITVPYGGPLRRLLRRPLDRLAMLRGWRPLRRLFGKPLGSGSLKAARAGTTGAWFPQFSYGTDGWYFYQYQFNKPQMRRFLAAAGLSVREEFVAFGDEGILHNFGRLAGRWNGARAGVDFTPLGRLLRRLIPVGVMGHMLCYVVEAKR